MPFFHIIFKNNMHCSKGVRNFKHPFGVQNPHSKDTNIWFVKDSKEIGKKILWGIIVSHAWGNCFVRVSIWHKIFHEIFNFLNFLIKKFSLEAFLPAFLDWQKNLVFKMPFFHIIFKNHMHCSKEVQNFKHPFGVQNPHSKDTDIWCVKDSNEVRKKILWGIIVSHAWGNCFVSGVVLEISCWELSYEVPGWN